MPVRIPEQMRRELALLARSETRGNVSALVRRLVRDGIEREFGRTA